jgi:hypothetical protein
MTNSADAVPGPAATTTVVDRSDPAGMSPDERAVWDEQKAIYGAFLTGDRARVDRRIHPEATIWDGVAEPLARGLADMDAIRATRPSADRAPVITACVVDSPVVTVYDDTAIGRHVLRVTSVATDPDSGERRTIEEVLRVSSAWRRIDGDWWVVHSHEDVFSTSSD